MNYECKKCGSDCEVEYDHSEAYWPDCWCDHCDDYAGGFDDVAGDYQADYISARADWAHDQAKDREMGL